jgi:hypothetical protein
MYCNAALTWPRTPRAGTTSRSPDAPYTGDNWAMGAASTRTSTAALCSFRSVRFSAKTGALDPSGAPVWFGAATGIAFLP